MFPRTWLLGAEIVAIAAGLMFAGGINAESKLLFSEYLEGSSNNKAIEIANIGTEGAQLNGWKIEKYTNGSPTVSGTVVLPEMVLGDGEVYVICNPSSAAEILSKCNLTSGVLNFNGNDALVLKQGEEIKDRIGQVGVDPGEGGWGSESVTTVNNTLIRKCGVINGDTDILAAFDPTVEWESLGLDSISNLGMMTVCITPTPLLPTPTQATPEPTTETTPTVEVTPTPTETPEPTLEPTKTPEVTSVPTLTPTPKKEDKDEKHHLEKSGRKWWCEKKTVYIRIGKKKISWQVPVCHWRHEAHKR